MKNEIEENGFAVFNEIYSEEEIELFTSAIANADSSQPTFRKTNDLFAIRQFFKEIPAAIDIVFNDKLNALTGKLFGNDFFVVKSIYFDKPEVSNWFVAYHQDLTISVDKKVVLEDFGPWTVKQNQFAVQPPLYILENNFTIRIHLDNTNEENGALKVIPGSHLKGIYRPETIDWALEKETFCFVEKGGVMLMKPLLLHASNRTTNSSKRRVLHIECSNAELPVDLNWSEYAPIPGSFNKKR
ncbi:MAG: phytanoyl-CoA dioxygenase family protein [Rhizobacter sp.]|nr:phytanoyl-CoA dioxygenase family protein [Ferruginibacter sp.]